MSLPVTVVTVAYGSSDVVRKWAHEWSSTGASCLISDNGNRIPSDISGKVRVLPFTGNKGFGSGINRAVLESTTPVVLITNPDTRPEHKESLDVLYDHHSRGSFTGAATVDKAGNKIHSTGIWPSRNWVRSQVFRPAESLWRSDRVDWLQGSLIMAHRDDFLELEGFSSNYPLYFEDVDICARAKKLGFNINVCPEAGFIHDEGSGSDRVTATRLACYHWGMLQFFRDHHPASVISVRKMLIAKCILRLAAYAVTDREAARGYYTALRSVYREIAPMLPGNSNG
ncbi:MAG: glycosyltransferase family 2 protein [Candidatus Sabulitectum sp.]|nr:glycosyltransferase family 2 protein [Candidatus Sabulitectum sp.]